MSQGIPRGKLRLCGNRQPNAFDRGVAQDAHLHLAAHTVQVGFDHIHPNPAGVKRVVARILPLVEQLLAKVGAP